MKKKIAIKNIRESVIQKQILLWLKNNGYLAWKNYMGPMLIRPKGKVLAVPNPNKGFPDITGILKNHPGKMFCIEVKSKVGKLSEDQKEWKDKLDKQNVPLLIARSVEDVSKFISGIDTIGLYQSTLHNTDGMLNGLSKGESIIYNNHGKEMGRINNT